MKKWMFLLVLAIGLNVSFAFAQDAQDPNCKDFTVDSAEGPTVIRTCGEVQQFAPHEIGDDLHRARCEAGIPGVPDCDVFHGSGGIPGESTLEGGVDFSSGNEESTIEKESGGSKAPPQPSDQVSSEVIPCPNCEPLQSALLKLQDDLAALDIAQQDEILAKKKEISALEAELEECLQLRFDLVCDDFADPGLPELPPLEDSDGVDEADYDQDDEALEEIPFIDFPEDLPEELFDTDDEAAEDMPDDTFPEEAYDEDDESLEDADPSDLAGVPSDDSLEFLENPCLKCDLIQEDLNALLEEQANLNERLAQLHADTESVVDGTGIAFELGQDTEQIKEDGLKRLQKIQDDVTAVSDRLRAVEILITHKRFLLEECLKEEKCPAALFEKGELRGSAEKQQQKGPVDEPSDGEVERSAPSGVVSGALSSVISTLSAFQFFSLVLALATLTIGTLSFFGGKRKVGVSLYLLTVLFLLATWFVIPLYDQPSAEQESSEECEEDGILRFLEEAHVIC